MTSPLIKAPEALRPAVRAAGLSFWDRVSVNLVREQCLPTVDTKRCRSASAENMFVSAEVTR